jgi:DNA polymerase-3 subunit alpha
LYAPIHNHSEYSALDGLSTCREIAARCQEIGCECCGITDHGTVAGHLDFAKEMATLGLKPIFGCELYHGVKTTFGKNERDQAHFVAGAMTDEGLRNLWRLVDAASTNFRYVGRVNWEMLEKHKEGVFATSACISGLVSKGILAEGDLDALNRYLEIYRDNFYIELHTYPAPDQETLNLELVRIAQERGIPLIYATDAHFASPDQYEVHDTYVAAQTGEDIFTDPNDRKMWHPKALFIQDEAQIRESLSYLPVRAVDEALENSGALAARCNASLPEISRHLPAFVVSKCPWIDPAEHSDTAAELFVNLVERGIEARYGTDASEEVWNRAAQEIEVFLDAGLEHYFLQAWDFCEFCNRNNIKRGPGRGSAAGAIVAYALGITDIDPLKYGLIFERFYNPGREKGFPDIDNDFPVAQRKRVREYLMDRWGQDKVRTIGTITRMKPKAVIDKMYKPCRISWDEKESLKKIIDHVPDIDILGPDSIGWDSEIDPGKTIYVMSHVGADVEKWCVDWNFAKHKEPQDDEREDLRRYFLEIIRVVCSRVSNYGVHPSGVVVSDVSLDDELPCMWNASQKIQVTCFPMSDVDTRRFVKQDLLGLRNLDTLQDWEDQVADRIQDIPWSQLDDDDLPEDGWKLLDQGLTLGIFQIEDGYAKRLCKEFKPRSIEDLGIIVALNRPGPIRSGAPDSFITRRNGGVDEEFDGRNIDILADILEPTYGWFLYQEQVIAYFTALGYDLGDADAVRKILGKKKPEAWKALYHGEGEWEGNGYKEMAARADLGDLNDSKEATWDGASEFTEHGVLAGRIWAMIIDFAKYSFNKSHAIAYATIAFRTLFAKYYGPAEFVMACIRTNSDDAAKYAGEGRRMDINVLPPHIDYSQPDIAVHGEDIYFGFSNIKGIGKGAGEYICYLRERIKDISSPEALFDALEAEQSVWEAERDAAKEAGNPFKKKSPRQQLTQNKIPLMEQSGAWDGYYVRDITLRERQKLEKELLGVILTDDCEEVFSKHAEYLSECNTYSELEFSDESVHLPGVISIIDPKKTKADGKSMGIVTIEFQGDQAEFVVFPKQWKDYKFLWRERTPGIFTLSRGDRGVKFEGATKLD